MKLLLKIKQFLGLNPNRMDILIKNRMSSIERQVQHAQLIFNHSHEEAYRHLNAANERIERELQYTHKQHEIECIYELIGLVKNVRISFKNKIIAECL